MLKYKVECRQRCSLGISCSFVLSIRGYRWDWVRDSQKYWQEASTFPSGIFSALGRQTAEAGGNNLAMKCHCFKFACPICVHQEHRWRNECTFFMDSHFNPPSDFSSGGVHLNKSRGTGRSLCPSTVHAAPF